MHNDDEKTAVSQLLAESWEFLTLKEVSETLEESVNWGNKNGTRALSEGVSFLAWWTLY